MNLRSTDYEADALTTTLSRRYSFCQFETLENFHQFCVKVFEE